MVKGRECKLSLVSYPDPALSNTWSRRRSLHAMASESVVLPCHPSCMTEDKLSVCEEYLDQSEIPQWALIRTLLHRPVQDVASLEDLLSNMLCDLQFSTLRSTLQYVCRKQPNFLTCVWPRMVTAALNLPTLFPDGLLMTLQPQVMCSVSLSREQIASLLVHMFLCSLQPPAWSKFWVSFGIWYNSESPPVKAYLLCLFDYFSQLDSSGKPPNPCETVQFRRHVLVESPDWSASTTQLDTGILMPSTNLEPEPGCNIEVSFANKDVGFGVSGTQEEVKMAMSPEACVAVLIVPTMQDNETLLIRGARQVGSCQGIGRNVTYTGTVVYAGERDWNGRWIIAMDAMELDIVEDSDALPLYGNVVIRELRGSVLQRELNKAFCGFSGIEEANNGDTDRPASIATGHWGCGSFGGNKQAKAVIQLMAAAEAKKLLVYHDIDETVGGEEATPFLLELETFVNFLVQKKVSVAQLYSVVLEAGHLFNKTEQSLLDICTKLLVHNQDCSLD